jgi:hypothetical protein
MKSPSTKPTTPALNQVEVEPRWPGLAAVTAAVVLNVLLPESLTAGLGWIPIAAIALLAAGALAFPHWHARFGYAASTVATLLLAHAVYVLVSDVAIHRGRPTELLQGALLIWSMNILVFAAWYWRLDAGGPHGRAEQEVYCGGAFLFPQLSLPKETRWEIGAKHWRPRFIDYLFVAFNASTAFSPTDVPVLSAWAKVLMMIQSSIALTTLAIVAARAVNIL